MQIDEDVIQKVVRMGFEKQHVVECLRNRIQNDVSLFGSYMIRTLVSIFHYSCHTYYSLFQATVAYYLLFDNRSPVPSGYLGDQFQEPIVRISLLFVEIIVSEFCSYLFLF